MRLNSIVLSLLISLMTSVFVTLVVIWLGGFSDTPWWGIVSITFLISYISAYGVLELFIFREIRKVFRIVKEMEGDETTGIRTGIRGQANLELIKNAVLSFAKLKQGEIDQLKNAAEYRREFLADVSHELKTPIFAAQGYVHTLLDGAVEDKNVRTKFLKKAAKNLDGLDHLVQDLLTLSRLENRQITMDFTSCNLYELAHGVFEQLEDKAETKGVGLRWGSGVYRDILVQADQRRIQQVMLNLVSNAINYTQTNGTVTVDFEVKKDKIVVHIADNGIGISPEHIDRIFERFYRVEKSRTKSKHQRGTGLGLAIVKHILELHHSQIQVKSTLGKGSDFYFHLTKAA